MKITTSITLDESLFEMIDYLRTDESNEYYPIYQNRSRSNIIEMVLSDVFKSIRIPEGEIK